MEEKAKARIKITVLTVEGNPSFEIDVHLLAPEVDKMVARAYGKQADGRPHNWRGDPVDKKK